MIDKLKGLLERSYSPYSHFPVAAIIIMKDGSEFGGVNVEDASTRAGTCAERAAMFSAISTGYTKGDFKEIHIMVSSGKIGMPCFVCRQMLVELFDLDSKVFCYSTNGEVKEFTVSEICPYPFSGDDLK